MEYVQRWIDLVRQDTENQTVPNSSGNEQAGIKDDQILRWFNEAQKDIQRAIQSVNTGMFLERTSQAVSGTAYQTLPTYSMLDGRVVKVEYGRNDSDRDYYVLTNDIVQQKLDGAVYSSSDYSPRYYTNEGRMIRLEPVPKNGFIRLTYKKRVPDLNIRQGKIESNVKSIAETELQSITLVNDGTIDETALANNQYISIVDAEGNITASNVYYTDYESSNKTLTVDNHSLATDTIANGNYVVVGKYATTHSHLPYECEDYLISWVNYRCMVNDDNFEQAAQEKSIRNGLRETILDAYRDNTDDVELISVTNLEWF